LADRLGIEDVRADWRSALDELAPDVVAITTPAGPHLEMAEYSARHGAHVVCEKPLGRTGSEARRMLDAVEAVGVKHAYGATSRYAPGLVRARGLIRAGAVGKLLQLDVVVHLAMSPLLPYCWLFSLEAGGGILLNAFPHILGQSRYISDGTPTSVIGHTEVVVDRVPVGPPLHDFRSWMPVDPDQAERGEWREIDADTSATAVVGMELSDGRMITALFHASAFGATRHAGYLAVHGTKGTIQLDDAPWFNRMYQRSAADGHWAEVPFEIDKDPIQAGWDRLIADFVADVSGSPHGSYPTFRDGCADNQLMDQIRSTNHDHDHPWDAGVGTG
jgi:predicted dehydrogenase